MDKCDFCEELRVILSKSISSSFARHYGFFESWVIFSEKENENLVVGRVEAEAVEAHGDDHPVEGHHRQPETEEPDPH